MHQRKKIANFDLLNFANVANPNPLTVPRPRGPPRVPQRRTPGSASCSRSAPPPAPRGPRGAPPNLARRRMPPRWSIQSENGMEAKELTNGGGTPGGAPTRIRKTPPATAISNHVIVQQLRKSFFRSDHSAPHRNQLRKCCKSRHPPLQIEVRSIDHYNPFRIHSKRLFHRTARRKLSRT